MRRMGVDTSSPIKQMAKKLVNNIFTPWNQGEKPRSGRKRVRSSKKAQRGALYYRGVIFHGRKGENNTN